MTHVPLIILQSFETASRLFSSGTKIAGIALFCLWCSIATAQKIEVIVPAQPVVTGTAFQVQYIITEPSEFAEVSTPVFDSCRLISGPNIYKGNATVDGRLQPIQNITYTLVPSRTGVLQIGSIKIRFKNGAEVQSKNSGVTVVPKPKASFSVRSSYTDAALYASSKEDRERLINENLFIKTEVDKKICYEGEPVVATFKLYSRLQSSSEAQKSPAFYGFSVVDMLNINEAHTAVETVNGKIFNTSILRQVQLYPVQAGELTIDEMYIQNEIEFDDSLNHSTTTVEREIITTPLTVMVKPLPVKKEEDFTGAVGDYSIQSRLENGIIEENGQGKLIVTVQGRGNFIQFGAPVINWPKGIEPFEPLVADEINKNTAPIEGERTYSFGFAVDTPGQYRIPAVSFSYFDLASKEFKQLVTTNLLLTVTPRHKRSIINNFRQKASSPLLWIVAFVILGVLLLFFWYKKRIAKAVSIEIKDSAKQKNYLTQLASLNTQHLTEKQTCIEIQKILTAFANEKSGSLSAEKKREIQNVIQACQLQIYSLQVSPDKVETLKLEAGRALKEA